MRQNVGNYMHAQPAIFRRRWCLNTCLTSISANADGPRDGASCKIDHIALPTEYTVIYLLGNERRSIANCYTDREMPVISTYLNYNAQTPLGGIVVYILYSQVCNKHGDKSN